MKGFCNFNVFFCFFKVVVGVVVLLVVVEVLLELEDVLFLQEVEVQEVIVHQVMGQVHYKEHK